MNKRQLEKICSCGAFAVKKTNRFVYFDGEVKSLYKCVYCENVFIIYMGHLIEIDRFKKSIEGGGKP